MDPHETKGRPAADPEQSIPAVAEEDIYAGWASAGLDGDQAFRATRAIRDQAGRNIADQLEIMQQLVVNAVTGLETRLTAKIDRVETELTAKVDGLATQLNSMDRQLATYRWALTFMGGVLALFLTAAVALAPLVIDRLWRDATPTESGRAPVEPDRSEPAEPPEPNPPAANPPQTGSLLRNGPWIPPRAGAWTRAYDHPVLAGGSNWLSAGPFRSSFSAARLVPDRGGFCSPFAVSGPIATPAGDWNAPGAWRGGVAPGPQARPECSRGWIDARATRSPAQFRVDTTQPGCRAAVPGACCDGSAASWQPVLWNGSIESPVLARFSVALADASAPDASPPARFVTYGRPVSGTGPQTSYLGPASGWTRAAAPFNAVAVAGNPLPASGAMSPAFQSGAVAVR